MKPPTKNMMFQRWASMISRCENDEYPQYKDYGGRGIKVCDRWHWFENFFEDVGLPPSREHQLDRIDNDGDYEPSNVRWSTRKENCANRRTCRLITYNGKTQPLVAWARETGIAHEALRYRLSVWSVEKALTTPYQK